MNQIRACIILDISPPLNSEKIKKKYYEKARLFHPDKNPAPNAAAQFQEIKEAFDFLQKTNAGDTFQEYFQQFLLQKFELLKRQTTTKNITQMLFYYNIFSDFKIFGEILVKMKKFIDAAAAVTTTEERPPHTFILCPTIDNLLDCVVYYGKTPDTRRSQEGAQTPDHFCVPLWHQELEFDDFIFVIKPKLPENITIDENNNIHVHIQRVLCEVLDTEYIDFVIGKRKFTLSCNQLQFRTIQIITLRGVGIPQINSHDIFNIEILGDIVVYLTILV
jgi:hypothetical protein